MLVNINKLKIAILILYMVIFSLPLKAQVWTLQQCIDTAQVYNKSLQIGKNNIVLSEQKHKEANAGLFPKVNAIADYKYFIELPYQLMPLSLFGGPEGQFKEAQFGVPHNINTNLQLIMPLFNSQVLGAMRTTKIASELTNLQYQKTEEQVFFEISDLYYNAQILLYQSSFIDSNIINTTILQKNMLLLKEQLMVKGTDVTKVQLQLEQLTTQKELVINKYEQVMNALKYSMGLSINQNILIDSVIIYQQSEDYSVSNLIDIQILETNSRFIKSELKTLKNSRLPSLSLYGTYGATGFGYDEKPNDFLNFYQTSFVGIQFIYPLFNGTVTKRKINQKKIEFRNSELQLSLFKDQNAMLIENAKNQSVVAQRTVVNTAEQIKLAQTVYSQTVLQHTEGTATITDVLLADNSLREAQQTYISAVIDYLKTDLELKKLTGNMNINKN
ncbi:MAG: transporter [Bacteroidetes bacterium GWC2_33_15]|nr:MAG: transporter [Bacteroidetes bacterium GWA2_33_15]OFX49701.1 MAG: transporter [Bacteroidetes bacterium GWC2_33_15]OFX65909.1 MAG: transporter [Bacteroidetes bacterium GWB2_32_14]OFX68330.1 MAG: transporter [Bacteroidetes bacterium GWD2_33_33]HAN18115.1 TolC family protein [Bacteroidales bacterium]